MTAFVQSFQAGARDLSGQDPAFFRYRRVIGTTTDDQSRHLDLPQTAGQIKTPIGSHQIQCHPLRRAQHLSASPGNPCRVGMERKPVGKMSIEGRSESPIRALHFYPLGDEPVSSIRRDGGHQSQLSHQVGAIQAQLLSNHSTHGMPHQDGRPHAQGFQSQRYILGQLWDRVAGIRDFRISMTSEIQTQTSKPMAHQWLHRLPPKGAIAHPSVEQNHPGTVAGERVGQSNRMNLHLAARYNHALGPSFSRCRPNPNASLSSLSSRVMALYSILR